MIKFKIPKGWTIKKIPEVLFFQEGPGVRKWQFKTTGIKLLNVGNIVDGKLDLNKTDLYLDEAEIQQKYTHFLVDEGDLIIASSGIKVEYFDKKVAFARREHLPLCMNTSTIRFKSLNPQLLDIKYFSYFLKTEYFKKQLSFFITGSAQLNFGPSHIKKMDILFPSLERQKEIVEILEKCEKALEKRKNSNKLADEYLKSTFVGMFGDPAKNPFDWKVYSINRIIKSIEAGWSVDGDQRQRLDHEFGVLKVSAVTSGFFKPEEYKVIDKSISIKKYVFPEKGDLLFSRANTRELVGATCIIEDDFPNLLLPDKLWKVKFLSNKVNVYYVKYLLSHKVLRERLSKNSTGTSGSMYNISMEKFKSIEIPVPPIELQNKFAQVVQKVEKLKQKQNRSSVELNTLFKSLMQKAFRGEL